MERSAQATSIASHGRNGASGSAGAGHPHLTLARGPGSAFRTALTLGRGRRRSLALGRLLRCPHPSGQRGGIDARPLNPGELDPATGEPPTGVRLHVLVVVANRQDKGFLHTTRVDGQQMPAQAVDNARGAVSLDLTTWLAISWKVCSKTRLASGTRPELLSPTRGDERFRGSRCGRARRSRPL